MSFKIIEPKQLPDIKIVRCKLYQDGRGTFGETFRENKFQDLNFPKFVQENVSVSQKGVVRGLHYQLNPKAQAKLIHCVSGSILDVVVDIRKSSPKYGKHTVVYLEVGSLLFVPEGFAHGFMALCDNTVVSYKVSNYYSPEFERGINYKDPELNIKWPAHKVIVSPKDKEAPNLKDAENNFE